MPELSIEDLQERIARRIRELARARRIPLTHLADRAGVSRAHLWNVLGGMREPTIGWLLRVANALDVDPVELFREGRSRGGS